MLASKKAGPRSRRPAKKSVYILPSFAKGFAGGESYAAASCPVRIVFVLIRADSWLIFSLSLRVFVASFFNFPAATRIAARGTLAHFRHFSHFSHFSHFLPPPSACPERSRRVEGLNTKN
jgi:hypothetical protein